MSTIILKIIEMIKLHEILIKNLFEITINVGDVVSRSALILYLEAFPPKQLEESPYYWWVLLVLKIDLCGRFYLCSYYLFQFYLIYFN